MAVALSPATCSIMATVNSSSCLLGVVATAIWEYQLLLSFQLHICQRDAIWDAGAVPPASGDVSQVPPEWSPDNGGGAH